MKYINTSLRYNLYIKTICQKTVQLMFRTKTVNISHLDIMGSQKLYAPTYLDIYLIYIKLIIIT